VLPERVSSPGVLSKSETSFSKHPNLIPKLVSSNKIPKYYIPYRKFEMGKCMI